MAVLTATTSVDMTDWNFNDIQGGTVGSHTSTRYAIDGAGGHLGYQFTGIGLSYDASHHLTGGTVTGYRVLGPDGTTRLDVSGLNLDGAFVQSTIDSGDAGGAFETAAFAHANTITGSVEDDVLVAFSPGTDTVDAGDGNDTILDTNSTFGAPDTLMGGAGDDNIFFGHDYIGSTADGGDGFDQVFFDGDMTAGVNVGIGMRNVEALVFARGHDYQMVEGDDTMVTAGAVVRIDGSALGAGNYIDFDGESESDGHFEMLGGAGNDNLRGGDLDDTFWLDAGGRDHAVGGLGTDTFYLGAKLAANDRINGGDSSGNDVVVLDGDYSHLVLADRTIRHIGMIELTGGHSYNLTLADGNVDPASNGMIVLALGLGVGDDMVVDGSAETDATLALVDGLGDDVLTGGAQADTLLFTGGTDTGNGGAGDDTLTFSQSFTAADRVDGGDGMDTLSITGDFSAGLVLNGTTLTSVEQLAVGDSFDYSVTLADDVVAAGQTFTATAAQGSATLSEHYSFAFDGSAETDAKLVLVGGDGDDTLTGGAKADSLAGGLGADLLKGGQGNDVYTYTDAAESTGRQFDTIDGLNGTHDVFVLPAAITARDATVGSGSLSSKTFDADLTAKIDAAHLGVGHFLVYNPSSGDFAGDTFLVVDQNGTAGYQAGDDLVIELTHATNLSTLSALSFGT